MPKKPKLSIIIVDYMKAKNVVQSVQSITEQETNFDIEILVIDNSVNKKNAEELEKVKYFPNIKLIINSENIGYTRANNRGVQISSGEYIAILNPDILFGEKNILQILLDAFEHYEEIGILGPRQRNPDKSVAMTVRAFPSFPLQIARRTFLRHLPFVRKKVHYDEMKHLDYTKTQEVDWLQSSFFLVKRDFWELLGGLNEEYFLFMADTEMCWNSWKNGKKVVFFAEVEVFSDGVRCSHGGVLDFFTNRVIRQHFFDALSYMKKHFFERIPRK
jgi:N-acetylglucosaminyl-diphospho-decaprenol L-rhamnosyltransferase